MNQTFWIWYPGDFEIYHGLLQNFSREERGFNWPAYWYMDDCRKNIKFERTYNLKNTTEFTVDSNADGYVLINDKKHRFREKIECNPGINKIEIFAGMITGVPAAYIFGDVIHSDQSWMVTDYVTPPVNVGTSKYYISESDNPSVWKFDYQYVSPVAITRVDDGTLYDFGRELTAELEMICPSETKPFWICYGESESEALDLDNCYYRQFYENKNEKIRNRAFRYVFISEANAEKISIRAKHCYVNLPSKAFFECNDDLVNRIWKASEETFQLCSGIFFIDGVKRDRWIWSGDAYQSYFVNQYLMFDEEINQRTIWALRGNDPIRQHINTIVDYSMYWIISIYNHFEMTGDIAFVRQIYPKIVSMMEFLETQLDEHHFIIGREHDWIFIDWAEIDKSGPVCAEQMLLVMCYRTMSCMEKILGLSESGYDQKEKQLIENLNNYYWLDEKHAYIDSFVSGKQQVSRHGNIFAILFDIADEKQIEAIYQYVLCNDEVPQITTPYFKFYELEALNMLGKHKEVLKRMKEYWGGILSEGALTIWEEYNPKQHGKEHYEMYGDPYGKSLCHAWGASPIYMIGRYFMGVETTDVAYRTFQVKPDITLFDSFHCRVPLKDGMVDIFWNGTVLCVKADRSGGTLICGEEQFPLKKNQEIRIKITS